MVRWKTRGRSPGVRDPGVWKTRGLVENARCGKRGFSWKTQGLVETRVLVENAGYRGKRGA